MRDIFKLCANVIISKQEEEILYGKGEIRFCFHVEPHLTLLKSKKRFLIIVYFP